MDSTSLNHYEERLYSVFKTFAVDNEEALNEAAVLALCDALQLEQRGAALVDTLFERRDQRVTFAQFRTRLLAVLGDSPPAPAPAPAPAPDPSAAHPAPEPANSDDDSSGREVAPKFVFGSKKYGRRSRPCRSRPAPCVDPSPSPPPPAPVTEPTTAQSLQDLELDHSSPVDCERALLLCRRLRMDGIERRLVESIFETLPAGETTVGEFFDRLNETLSTTIDDGTSADSGAPGGEEEEPLPAALVLEAWGRAGVRAAPRLLADLGQAGAELSAARLERALEEAAESAPAECAPLLRAALGLARVRRERARARAARIAAERDRLRAHLEEADRRARLLALEVDDSHARLQAELSATLRRGEARHADRLRALEAERAAERDRAAGERAALEAEGARRAEAEAALRAEADALRARGRVLEGGARAAEERAAAVEREAARLRDEAAAAAARESAAAEEARREAGALAARLEELRAENAGLRDRCDELCAQLEARPAHPAHPPHPAHPHSWHEEAGELAVTPLHLEGESPPVSLDPPEVGAGVGAGAEAAELRAQLAEADARHAEEKQRLEDVIKGLEAGLEALRAECERGEEYWRGVVAEERAALAEEQRAGDERLAELARRVAEYERRFAARLQPPAPLPAIPEAPALERHAAELDAAAADLQRRDHRLQELEAAAERDRDQLQRQQRHLARLAHALSAAGGGGGSCGAGGGAGGCAALRARVCRAEAGAARLGARLAAADRLVKELYVENCLLGPPPRHL